ncbi:MAG TPA: c-type cytochrome domain-containing protein [Gemmata sp.]
MSAPRFVGTLARCATLVVAFGVGGSTVRGGPKEPPAAPKAPQTADLAAKARAVFEVHCHRCHGKDGAAEGGFNTVLDRRRLVERKRIVPAEPGKSPLLERVVKNEMPPAEEKERPTADEIAVLKRWVEAGAQDWAAAPKPRRGISLEEVARLAHDDDMGRPQRLKESYRYFTIAHLYNAGYSDDELQTVRLALARILNSTSRGTRIVLPVAIDPEKTVLRIDLTDYGWESVHWNTTTFTDPFALRQRHAKPNEAPYVYPVPTRADWFVFAASRPPVYHTLADIPLTIRELEQRLKVDAAKNVRDARVVRSGFNGSGVSRNNRLIERHEGGTGYYWRSYDFDGADGRKNLFAFPLGPDGDRGFRHAGGEVIFRRPNGTQGYMLANARGERIDTGPTGVVSDPKHPDRVVENGISCMSCHARGLIDKADQIRAHVEKNGAGFTEPERNTVAALHPERDAFSAVVKADTVQYLAALAKLGGPVAGTDPVVATALRFEADLDLRQAAAETWTTPEGLVKALDANPHLARTLGALKTPGGTVSRKVMAGAFPFLAAQLKLTNAPEFRFLTETGALKPTAGRPVPVVQGTAYERGAFQLVKARHQDGVIPAPKVDPTFRWLAAVAADEKTVKLFEAATGELKYTLAVHEQPVISMAFSGDGLRLATAGREGRIFVTDTKTGKVVSRTAAFDPGPFVKPVPQFWAVALSPDGERLMSTGFDQGEVQVWDAATGKSLKTIKATRTFVGALQFSQDGKHLFIGDNGIMPLGVVWDLKAAKKRSLMFGGHSGFYAMAFAPDGKSFAVTQGDGTLRLLDATKGESLGSGLPSEGTGYSDERPGLAHSVAFTPDGKHLVTGHKDGTIVVWSAEGVRPLYSFLAHPKERVWGVQFSSDGKRLVSSTVQGAVRFWDGAKVIADAAGR